MDGVKAAFFPLFLHSARLLRSMSGLWLAADSYYSVTASDHAGSNCDRRQQNQLYCAASI